MKKIFVLSFALFSMMLFQTSCRDEISNDPIPGDTDNTLVSVNIVGVKSMFIASSASGAKLYGVKADLNRSTSDEQVFEIKYYNAAGDTISKSNPAYIYNMKDFIILAFGSTYYGFEEVYLVKKLDGIVFKISRDYYPHVVANRYTYDEMYVNTFDKIQEDANNNMYFMTYLTYSPHKKTIYKVSLSSPSSLEFIEVSAVTDDVKGFCVDNSGNILYSYYGETENKYRFRYAAGNFANFVRFIPNNYNSQYMDIVWTGTDGVMYGALEVIEGGVYARHDLVKIENGAFTVLKPLGVRLSPMESTSNDYDYINNIFNVQGKIFYSQNNKLINISNVAECVALPCAVVANLVLNNNLFSFNSTTFALTAIDISTGNTSLVYDLDETKLSNFDIDKIIDVSSLEGITFSAVNLNNGQYVVVKISTDNTVTIQNAIVGTITTVMALN